MHHDISTVHASYRFLFYYFCANLQSTLGFFLFVCVFVLILAPCLGRLEQIGLPPFPLCPPLGVSCLGMTDAERFLRN